MKPIDLVEVRNECQGRKLNEIVQYHINRANLTKLELCFEDTKDRLSLTGQDIAKKMTQLYSMLAATSDLWHDDCSTIFDHVTDKAREMFDSMGEEPDDEDIYNVWMATVLHLTILAYMYGNVRKVAGIKKHIKLPLTKFMAGIAIGLLDESWLMTLGSILGWGIVFCAYVSILERDRLRNFVADSIETGRRVWGLPPVMGFYVIEFWAAVIGVIPIVAVTRIIRAIF